MSRWEHRRQTSGLPGGLFGRQEGGLTLIETSVALAILGIVALALLAGLSTSFKAASINNEQAIAETLVISQLEYVKGSAYATEYAVDPNLDIPVGWTVPVPTVETVYATENTIQKIEVKAVHHGKEVLSINTYKVER